MEAIRRRLERRIDQALGDARADLVVRNTRTLNLVTGELDEGDVAFATILSSAHKTTTEARQKLMRAVKLLCRVSSTAMCIVKVRWSPPGEFDRCVLPRGTTTAICDPHEIANVIGTMGLSYFMQSALGMVMDLRVQLSSCVPAKGLETSGARLTASDLIAHRGHPQVIGLAEFMNVPGVLAKDPECLDKLAAFQDGHIDGHSPLPVRQAAKCVSRLQSAQLPRDDELGGGAREDRERHAGTDPRRHRIERHRGAGRLNHAVYFTVRRAVHRRSQPARHR
jgi:adenine deaminase